jgi:hypothetical protein
MPIINPGSATAVCAVCQTRQELRPERRHFDPTIVLHHRPDSAQLYCRGSHGVPAGVLSPLFDGGHHPDDRAAALLIGLLKHAAGSAVVLTPEHAVRVLLSHFSPVTNRAYWHASRLDDATAPVRVWPMPALAHGTASVPVRSITLESRTWATASGAQLADDPVPDGI